MDYVITINDELTSKRLEFGLETLEDREKREEWEIKMPSEPMQTSLSMPYKKAAGRAG